MKKTRSLPAIADEIRVALKRETADVITIGGLLAEAQKQVDYGGWLVWLRKEFSLSQRSARRYVSVHKFATSRLAKLANVAELKLRVSALYMLAEEHLEPAELKAVLREAGQQWVGATRAREIINALRPRPKPGDEPVASDEPDFDDAESNPEPPPPPAPLPVPLPHDTHLANRFATAIGLLMTLVTKPSAKFINAAPAAHLQVVANFLMQVAARSREAATPETERDLNIPGFFDRTKDGDEPRPPH